MRGLNDRQRHEAIEDGETLIDAGRYTGNQQYRAGEKSQCAGNLWHDGGDVDGSQLMRARKP